MSSVLELIGTVMGEDSNSLSTKIPSHSASTCTIVKCFCPPKLYRFSKSDTWKSLSIPSSESDLAVPISPCASFLEYGWRGCAVGYGVGQSKRIVLVEDSVMGSSPVELQRLGQGPHLVLFWILDLGKMTVMTIIKAHLY